MVIYHVAEKLMMSSFIHLTHSPVAILVIKPVIVTIKLVQFFFLTPYHLINYYFVSNFFDGSFNKMGNHLSSHVGKQLQSTVHHFLANQTIIITILVFIVLQTIMIVILYINLKKRRIAEKRLTMVNEQLDSSLKQQNVDLEWSNALLERKIMEYQETQVQLVNSEKRYRTLVEQSPEGVIVYDSEGCIVFVNSSSAKILEACNPDDLLGQNILPFIHPDYQKIFTKNIQNVLKHNEILPFVEYKIKTVEGTVLNAELSATPINYLDNSAIQLVFRDITLRKKIESELRRMNANLKKSNDELQNFAYIASHDLKEPLRKIKMFGDLLNRRYSSNLPSEGKDFIERMQSASQRMFKLIQALLDYSRIQTRAHDFEFIDLNDVLNHVLMDLEMTIQDCHAEIHLVTLPEIEADPFQMHQLFQNIISNSLKYRKQTELPVIQINVKTYEILSTNPGHKIPYCDITLMDNGIGFEEEYNEKIFNIFERLHSQEVYEGTGIGLAICRRIVERHNGRISAKSSPDHGSIFTITLPLRQPFIGKENL